MQPLSFREHLTDCQFDSLEEERSPKKGRFSKIEPFDFPELLPELQQLIFNSFCDMPTQYSLALTSTHNYTKFHKPEFSNPYEFTDQCASYGYADLLEYGVENGCPLDESSTFLAAEKGHLAILQVFYQHKIQQLLFCGQSILTWTERAKRSNHTHIIISLSKSREQLYRNLTEQAAINGNFELAKIYFEKTYPFYEKDLILLLVESGNLEALLKFRTYYQANYPNESMTDSSFSSYVMTESMRYGKFDIVQWCLNNSNIEPQMQGIFTRNVQILRLLFDHYPENHSQLIQSAFEIGSYMGLLEFFKLGVEKGGRLDIHLISRLFIAGEMLYFPHKLENRLECIQYIHTMLNLERAPITITSRHQVLTWASKEALNWMQKQGYPFRCNVEKYFSPHQNQDLDMEMIKWVLDQKMEFPPLSKMTILALGNIPLLELILGAGYEGNIPDNITIKGIILHMLSKFKENHDANYRYRFRIRPYVETCKWLIDKGYGWGDFVWGRFDGNVRDSANPLRSKYSHFFDELIGLGMTVE